MDTIQVVVDQPELWLDFLQKFDAQFPLCAAFWLQETEDSRRYLFLSSPRMVGNSDQDGYRAVIDLVRKYKQPILDPFRVKLVSPEHRFVKAVQGLQRVYGNEAALDFPDGLPNGTGIGEVFVYPIPISATKKRGARKRPA